MAMAVIVLVLFLPFEGVDEAAAYNLPEDGEEEKRLNKLFPIFQKLKEIKAQQINAHNANALSSLFEASEPDPVNAFSNGFSNGFS